MNSVSALMEVIRERAHAPAQTRVQSDLSNALYLLCELQLALTWLTEQQPDNPALQVLRTYLDGQMIVLDQNIRNCTPVEVWLGEQP